MTKKKDCFTVFAMTLTDKPALAIEVASFYFMLKILRRAQNDKNKRYNGKRDPCGNALKITYSKRIALTGDIFVMINDGTNSIIKHNKNVPILSATI